MIKELEAKENLTQSLEEAYTQLVVDAETKWPALETLVIWENGRLAYDNAYQLISKGQPKVTEAVASLLCEQQGRDGIVFSVSDAVEYVSARLLQEWKERRELNNLRPYNPAPGTFLALLGAPISYKSQGAGILKVDVKELKHLPQRPSGYEPQKPRTREKYLASIDTFIDVPDEVEGE